MKARDVRPGHLVAVDGGVWPVVCVNLVQTSAYTNGHDDGRHKQIAYVHYKVDSKTCRTMPMGFDDDIEVRTEEQQ